MLKLRCDHNRRIQVMLPFKTEIYTVQKAAWPDAGKHILAHYDQASVIVYQAYNAPIADYAVQHQYFGGSFSFNRMSWIKPNFLWMMYRCGWAEKTNQERVLAIRITRAGFENILAKAVHSAYLASTYADPESWHSQVKNSEVRLQWDPDHNPYGNPVSRRAIQLGLRGSILKSYAYDWIISITDITAFVKTGKHSVDRKDLGSLNMPFETVYEIEDAALAARIFAD